MREELLTHVVGVFEEEARLGDEPAALARTQERFGQPAELTDQLQASVPSIDRVFAENFAQSPLGMAAQVAAAMGVLVLLQVGIMILIACLRGHAGEWLTVTRAPALLAPLWVASLAFCGTFLIHGMRQALFAPAGRSWLRAGLFAAAAWMIVPIATFAISLPITVDLESSLREIVVPLLPFGGVAPVALIALVCLFHSQDRQAREWACLELD
jgi:hypothetical protein